MSPLELLSRFKDARVLVVGDVMLDRFVYARVSRISPEAPVPVLAVEHEALSLGGAGNVARNIASLGRPRHLDRRQEQRRSRRPS